MRENLALLCGVILMVTTVSASPTRVDDLLYLDLSALRATSDSVQINWPPHTSTGNNTKIYCAFPGDVFCDLTALERREFFKLRPVTTEVYLKYTHPNFREAVGFAKFENEDQNTNSRLFFKYFSVYALPHTTADDWVRTIERRLKQYEAPEVRHDAIPSSLPSRDAVALEVHDRSTENLSFKCSRKFKRVEESEDSVDPALVAFRLDEFSCISSAPPQERTDDVDN